MKTGSDSTTQNIVRFAHFTDLHVGMNAQQWMWPSFKRAFLEDLERMCFKLGALDFVIFSGDLTQKSSKTEYAKLTEVLGEIWGVFSKFGKSPALIPVPGNHDLARPPALNPTAKVLSQ
ncbi:metallophosphoesterase [Pseudomonas sp. J452]|uniref:metallophosphoesterase family protein n=1 Tax=Pseudomonas sp. J452 TaxID=2898441 RepID=UPI0021ADE3EB|nr:metallophosphoesterase [Pseudomonas sp. J452]UUY08008.1 metallophosphoesterase [Pseudomonas sp. J452]